MTIAARPSLLFDMGYAYSLGKVVSTPVGAVQTPPSLRRFRTPLRLAWFRRSRFRGSMGRTSPATAFITTAV